MGRHSLEDACKTRQIRTVEEIAEDCGFRKNPWEVESAGRAPTGSTSPGLPKAVLRNMTAAAHKRAVPPPRGG